uniref:Putative secreted protein n=1 Tax=Ixodes ricinus TaxID=34613 RepID=A0A6B0U0M2_IXORI
MLTISLVAATSSSPGTFCSCPVDSSTILVPSALLLLKSSASSVSTLAGTEKSSSKSDTRCFMGSMIMSQFR